MSDLIILPGPAGDVSHITGNIWMGGKPVGNPDPSFKFIVNVHPFEPYNLLWHQVMITSPLLDEPKVPDEVVLHSLADTALLFASKGKTLIHCQAGLNRSGIITALVLIKQGLTPEDAIKLIREKRSPNALFNQTFAAWILNQKS